jgi:hypothetical protein
MKIALISCVKTKLNTKIPVRADELYQSALFKKSYEYCKNRYDKVYILSAKYGLLEINDMILPYEKTLNKMSKKEKEIWYNNVFNSLKNKINKEDIIYYHCGNNYRQGLIDKLDNIFDVPLLGVSFGNQLKFYKEQLNNQLKLV